MANLAARRKCPVWRTWKDLHGLSQLDGEQPDGTGAQHRRGCHRRQRVVTLSRKITVDVRGEILQLKEAINTMVDQLRSFASEVTRVAREVGTDGKLAGRRMCQVSRVPGKISRTPSTPWRAT